jgi:hypothetical protein
MAARKKVRSLKDLAKESEAEKAKLLDEKKPEIKETDNLIPGYSAPVDEKGAIVPVQGASGSGSTQVPDPEAVSADPPAPELDPVEKVLREDPPVRKAKRYTFISKLKGYSFPDPRDKPPADPHLAKNFAPRIIRFILGRYATTDEDEAAAIYRKWKGLIANGITPDFQPIDSGTADRVFRENQGKVTHGTLSVETAKARGETLPDFRSTSNEGGEAPTPAIPDGLDDEFCPAPGG